MRWVAITLILMNVVYFSWRWLTPDNTVTAVPPNSERQLELDPQSVTLQPSARLPIIEEQESDDNRSTESLPVETPTTHSLSVELSTTPAQTSAQAEADLASEETLSSTLEEKTSTAHHMATSPEISVATAKSVDTSIAAANGQNPSSALAASDEERCYWTEWHDLAWKASATMNVLKTEQKEVEIGRSYLVWIPPKATAELTIERLRELKSLSIESAFINKGEQKGGISLGLFSAEESVGIRMREAEALGITDAKPLTRVRTQTQTRALIKQTAESNEEISEKWQKTVCLPIANTAVAK